MKSSKPIVSMASWVGDFHTSLLLEDRDSLGEVVSVFNKTLNIKAYNGELVVVIAGALRSPININLSLQQSASFKDLVRHGSGVSAVDGKLFIGDLVLSIRESKHYRNHWVVPTIESLKKFATKMGQVTVALNLLAREGSLINPDNTTRNLLSNFFEEIDCISGHLADLKSIDRLSSVLGSMCGIGPGFTPAGDDFIMGYLAMHNRLSGISGLKMIKLDHAHLRKHTTWISTKMIEYAQRSLHDEVVELALNSVARGDVSSYISTLAELGPRGHTSGIDMATGMTICMCVIGDYLTGSDCANHCRKALLS